MTPRHQALYRREFLKLAGGAFLSAVALAQSDDTHTSRMPFRLATGCPVADPFCTKTAEGWYLAGTQHDRAIEDRRFIVFFSADLRAWRDLGPVLVRPEYEGSHRANCWAPEFVEHAITGRKVTIPHHARDMAEGTLRAILHEAGISIDDFLGA